MKLKINIFWIGIQALWLQLSFAKETDFRQQLNRGGVDLISEILFCPRKYVTKKKHEKKLVNFCFAMVLPVDNSPFGFAG